MTHLKIKIPISSTISYLPCVQNLCKLSVSLFVLIIPESLFELLAVCGAKCVEDPVALMSQSVKHKIIVRCSDSDAEPSAVEIDMFNGELILRLIAIYERNQLIWKAFCFSLFSSECSFSFSLRKFCHRANERVFLFSVLPHWECMWNAAKLLGALLTSWFILIEKISFAL